MRAYSLGDQSTWPVHHSEDQSAKKSICSILSSSEQKEAEEQSFYLDEDYYGPLEVKPA